MNKSRIANVSFKGESFTEHETRSFFEQKPTKDPQNSKDKCVGSIQFGSLNLAAENSSVNTNGELKKGEADGTVKSAGSQERLDASRPASSDKNNDSDAKLPRKNSLRVPEHVVQNGIIKEISESNKSLNNGVAVKTDPIGLDNLSMSDGESDPVYKASSSKFQALDNEDFSSDSSSGSIQRKKNLKVPTESVPPVKDFTPRGLINAGNLCFLNATLQALLSCSPFVQLLQKIQLQDIPKVFNVHCSFCDFGSISYNICFLIDILPFSFLSG